MNQELQMLIFKTAVEIVKEGYYPDRKKELKGYRLDLSPISIEEVCEELLNVIKSFSARIYT